MVSLSGVAGLVHFIRDWSLGKNPTDQSIFTVYAMYGASVFVFIFFFFGF